MFLEPRPNKWNFRDVVQSKWRKSLSLYVKVACLVHSTPPSPPHPYNFFSTRSEYWKVCGSFMLIYSWIFFLGKIENAVVKQRLSPCVNTFKACHGWSRLGYCSSNSKERFMREYCRSSCNLCVPIDPDYLSTSCRLTFCVHSYSLEYLFRTQVVKYINRISIQGLCLSSRDQSFFLTFFFAFLLDV